MILLHQIDYTTHDQILSNYQILWSNEYLTDVWKSWLQLRCHIILTFVGLTLSRRWRITNVIRFMHPFAMLDHAKALNPEELLGRMGITTILELWDKDSHSWRPLEFCLNRIYGLMP